MPGLRAGTEEQTSKGMYLLEEAPRKTPRVNLWARARFCARASRQGMCWRRIGVWRPTSGAAELQRLARDGQDADAGICCTRPSAACAFRVAATGPYVGPVVAFHRLHEELRPSNPRLRSARRVYKVAGHRRLGRSDFRASCASTSKSIRHYIAVAAVKALAEEAHCRHRRSAEAIKKYGINADKINPRTPDKNRRRQQNGIGGSQSPDIGDFKDVEIIELLVKPGDTVKSELSPICH